MLWSGVPLVRALSASAVSDWARAAPLYAPCLSAVVPVVFRRRPQSTVGSTAHGYERSPSWAGQDPMKSNGSAVSGRTVVSLSEESGAPRRSLRSGAMRPRRAVHSPSIRPAPFPSSVCCPPHSLVNSTPDHPVPLAETWKGPRVGTTDAPRSGEIPAVPARSASRCCETEPGHLGTTGRQDRTTDDRYVR